MDKASEQPDGGNLVFERLEYDSEEQAAGNEKCMIAALAALQIPQKTSLRRIHFPLWLGTVL